jgi:flagellar biogenesis protein FliO
LTGLPTRANLTLMYDIVRWILLVLLFAGLLGLWLWSRRQAANQGLPSGVGGSFKILQKRWVDQRTGVCLVEVEDKKFLLAYTVGGGVSWQPLDPATADIKPASAPFIAHSALPEPKRL